MTNSVYVSCWKYWNRYPKISNKNKSHAHVSTDNARFNTHRSTQLYKLFQFRCVDYGCNSMRFRFDTLTRFVWYFDRQNCHYVSKNRCVHYLSTMHNHPNNRSQNHSVHYLSFSLVGLEWICKYSIPATRRIVNGISNCLQRSSFTAVGVLSTSARPCMCVCLGIC